MRYLEKKRNSEHHITYVHVNDYDESDWLSLLYETNQKYFNIKNDLNNLVYRFVEENRWNTMLLSKIHIWMDWFLWALRRIDRAYKSYIMSMSESDIKKNISPNEHDLRHIYYYTFLHNTKCLLEIIKISKLKLKKNIDKDFKKKVTDLRNLFAHEYEKKEWRPQYNRIKKLFQKSVWSDLYFISLFPNHYIEDIGIPEIQIYSIKNGKYSKSIHFSLPYLYQTVYDIINSLEIRNSKQ